MIAVFLYFSCYDVTMLQCYIVTIVHERILANSSSAFPKSSSPFGEVSLTGLVEVYGGL